MIHFIFCFLNFFKTSFLKLLFLSGRFIKILLGYASQNFRLAREGGVCKKSLRDFSGFADLQLEGGVCLQLEGGVCLQLE
ncbi:hypothetical protein MmiHf6_00740 [Methanimicrococcus hongohii]|uniref:Uncharacterized protein n=1 Tax=Methanimicrococcus hongohii TaxID=3028295 RepID=A0AA96ZRX5_9EURY|nr:hypothetical protein MmiHf6_00740 [Methanimicrococcus sp. Hf6]